MPTTIVQPNCSPNANHPNRIALTFPSSYQILPDYPACTDQYGTKTNILEDDRWLDEKHKPLLQICGEFRRELGTASAIPIVTIFGYGIKTISEVSVVRDTDGKIQDVEYRSENIGDASVLEQSAFLPGSEIHPVRQNHGSLFVDNDVKMRLKLELTRPYCVIFASLNLTNTWQYRVSTNRLRNSFDTDKSNLGSLYFRLFKYLQSIRLRTASAACQSGKFSIFCIQVTIACLARFSAGCPKFGLGSTH